MVCGVSISVQNDFSFQCNIPFAAVAASHKSTKSYTENDAEIIPLVPLSLNCYVHTLDEVSEWRV